MQTGENKGFQKVWELAPNRSSGTTYTKDIAKYPFLRKPPRESVALLFPSERLKRPTPHLSIPKERKKRKLPLTARFYLPQRPRQAISGPMSFHKGVKTLSALITARNSLPMCEEWHTCDRTIHALVHGFIVSTTVTPDGHHKNNNNSNSNGVQVK
ncbi:MAG: hypothetical protein Q9203_003498 [Teloschistes exilis]